HLCLDLEGKGALTLPYQTMFTREFRNGKDETIEPGKTFTLEIKSLAHGFRGTGDGSYWTEPGEYKLAAKLKTVSPQSSHSRKMAVLTTDPVSLKVVPPKPASGE
ncbi:MAG: hypothetical protein SGJ20_19585, partial [Planctomycetota bacterium]|nr:hypothetical protein [Planctomycetota bacterium]